ncbi:OLC1v1022408C2 [Oldenlandia corymbosa var. corymbosa]|nr:OLC1v1022408C2 [Oldenlandia corymbosa var. corymbosa]
MMNLDSTVISCSKGRDYSSKSGPMRYIPKRSSGIKDSEVSSSQLNDVKQRDSVESNGKRVELSRSKQNILSVVDAMSRKQHQHPFSKINYNEEYSTKRLAQSNGERFQLSGSSESSRMGGTLDVNNECEIEYGKPLSNTGDNIGSGTGSVVPPNVQRHQPTVQASASRWSYFADTDFKNQSEKTSNIKNDNTRGSSQMVQPDVERIDFCGSSQTSSSSRNIAVEPQFQNLTETSVDNARYEKESGTDSSVISEGVPPLCSSRTFVAGTELNYNKEPVEKSKHDVRLGKNRVFQSSIQKVESASSGQTSAGRRSFVLNTEGLGVGEEFDGDMRFEDDKFVEEFDDFLEENSKGNRRSKGVKVKEDVQKLAVELLAMRALTAMELRKKLQGKNCPLHIVDAVIRDFKSRGLINDDLYAETFSRSRWASSTWGPSRIKQALYSKGVSSEDAEKAVKLVFSDDASADVEESSSRLGMSKLSMDHLFAQATKQWMRSSDVCIEKRKLRVIRWLQYRGFSWSVISMIMKKLESKYPT